MHRTMELHKIKDNKRYFNLKGDETEREELNANSDTFQFDYEQALSLIGI